MESQVSRMQLFWLSWLSVAQPVASVAFLVSWAQFRDLYEGFTVTPPPISKAIIAAPQVVWWILVVLGLVQLFTFMGLVIKRTRQVRRTFVAVAVVNLAFVAGVFVALYLPIVQLGSPV